MAKRRTATLQIPCLCTGVISPAAVAAAIRADSCRNQTSAQALFGVDDYRTVKMWPNVAETKPLHRRCLGTLIYP